jgi:hypothetical protein
VPKGYSSDLVAYLRYKTIKDGIGVVLAKKCIAANIPSTIVAKVMGVSRQTIYAWFRGAEIQSERIPMVKAFIRTIEKDTAAKILPLQDYKSSKQYYISLIGPA